MSFPTGLSNAIDGVTEIVAAHLNNLEAKVGIDNSAVVTSLDYLLKNAGSIDPGHKHSKLWASDGSPEAVTVDAAGNVGIGTAPDAPVHIAKSLSGVNEFTIHLQNTAAGGGSWLFHNHATGGALGAGNFGIGDLYGYRLVIRNTSGNVGIGTTSPGYLLTCNGEPGANGYTAWTNYSDIRFKQNIVPLKDNILTRVLKLNPVTFSYNDKNPWGEKPGERTLYGLIAQELQGLFPDMVGEAQGPDGEKYLTTNLSNLTLYIVQAIKEQQTQIETLQTKLN